MRRLIGLVILLVGLSGLALGVFGIVATRQLVQQLGDSANTALALSAQSLDTTLETLELTRRTVEQVNDSLGTIGDTATNVSTALEETQPLLGQVTTVATEDVPASLEAVEAAVPNLAEAAAAVDSTLRLLDAFSLEQQVFGIPLSFDLGVDYDPNAPLDEAVTALGDGLDGVPESLRALQADLQRANANLAVVGGNVGAISRDLETINDSVAEIGPLLDEYVDLISDIDGRIERSQTGLQQQLNTIELIMTALFVWIALSQFVPLYLGLSLLRGQEMVDEDEVEMLEEVERERMQGREGDSVNGRQESDQEESDQEDVADVGADSKSGDES
ncbi:MAG: hypothetical protein R3300_06210 [Candidatus Promineifilaceae bacterium]|nr:hypothetical protein [Candidatus Promineifilaceae bacterium]